MGFLRNIKKAIHKRGVIGAIAKNAINQFNKWKIKDPKLSEAEIAFNIFILRYSLGVFTKKEKEKILKYLESEFNVDTLIGFCLVSLDIEGNINPMDKNLLIKQQLYLKTSCMT